MPTTSRLLLRIALAFAFLYPAYAIHQSPSAWVGYFPSFIDSLGLSQAVILWGFSTVHVILGLWILSGWRIFLPSIVAAVFLLSVVALNLSELEVLFRDISLALAGLALAFNKS